MITHHSPYTNFWHAKLDESLCFRWTPLMWWTFGKNVTLDRQGQAKLFDSYPQNKTQVHFLFASLSGLCFHLQRILSGLNQTSDEQNELGAREGKLATVLSRVYVCVNLVRMLKTKTNPNLTVKVFCFHHKRWRPL